MMKLFFMNFCLPLISATLVVNFHSDIIKLLKRSVLVPTFYGLVFKSDDFDGNSRSLFESLITIINSVSRMNKIKPRLAKQEEFFFNSNLYISDAKI